MLERIQRSDRGHGTVAPRVLLGVKEGPNKGIPEARTGTAPGTLSGSWPSGEQLRGKLSRTHFWFDVDVPFGPDDEDVALPKGAALLNCFYNQPRTNQSGNITSGSGSEHITVIVPGHVEKCTELIDRTRGCVMSTIEGKPCR